MEHMVCFYVNHIPMKKIFIAIGYIGGWLLCYQIVHSLLVIGSLYAFYFISYIFLGATDAAIIQASTPYEVLLFSDVLVAAILAFYIVRTLGRKLLRETSKSNIPVEEVIARVPANLFRGMEAVGGHLVITRKELIFEPHVFNVQKYLGDIPLSEVEGVAKKNTWGLIPNGMVIKMRTAEQYQFVLWQRSKIIDLINGLLQPSAVVQVAGQNLEI
jgi:hypothetical protein